MSEVISKEVKPFDYAAAFAACRSAADPLPMRDGHAIPCLGFGTWQIFDDAAGQVPVLAALKAGYRHIDAAAMYKSEVSVGKALKQSGLKRSEVFITSKVWKDDLSADAARRSLLRTLRDLDTDYLDLLLIHWPRRNARDRDWEAKLAVTWQAFINFKHAGLVKSIGVANFLPHHFEALHTELPAVNQIEFHVGYTQKMAVDYCHCHNILVEGWAALGRSEVLHNENVKYVAEQHNLSPAQVCLRYCMQKGVLPLAKSSNPERIRQNLDVFSFTLSDKDMALLDAVPDKTGWSGEHPDSAIPMSDD